MNRLAISCVSLLALSSSANAGVIYEDITYWMPNGQTLINPTVPPINAWIKVQETVYDDAQGRSILQTLLGINAINGPAVPLAPSTSTPTPSPT